MFNLTFILCREKYSFFVWFIGSFGKSSPRVQDHLIYIGRWSFLVSKLYLHCHSGFRLKKLYLPRATSHSVFDGCIFEGVSICITSRGVRGLRTPIYFERRTKNIVFHFSALCRPNKIIEKWFKLWDILPMHPTFWP